MWTDKDSHMTLLEAQSKLRKVFDQASNIEWVANYLIKLIENDVLEHQQTPCDFCPRAEFCDQGYCPFL